MRPSAGSPLLLLLVCCVCAAQGQQDAPRRSVWDDPVTFTTKDKDACAMHVTGQGDVTTLRVACQGRGRSYWCDYRGRPQACRSYSRNPRHYFTQISWDLRKLPHACRGPSVFKPHMCRQAGDEARMVLIGSASEDPTAGAGTAPSRQRPSGPTRAQPHKPTGPQPARPTRPNQAKSDQGRPVRPWSRNNNQRRESTPNPTPPSPTQSPSKVQARKMAQDYCWRSLQGVCTYFIGLFRN